MQALRIEILSREIAKHFKGVAAGHCARVDFLPREEASAICQHLRQSERDDGVKTYLLVGRQQAVSDGSTITTDHAIEIRNRKQESLCLFVPTDIVDTAASSLGNSFAVIDGRVLYEALLRQLRSRLSAQAQKIVQAVFGQLRGTLKVSKEQQISFVSAVLEREAPGELERVGLELWRVGLIADGRSVLDRDAAETVSAAFLEALDNNRRCVRALAYPARIHASPAERIQALLVDEGTERRLKSFFRGRSLQEVGRWSEALIEKDLTFDRWRFPEEEQSDIQKVIVQPFLDAAEQVERYSHLAQPNGPGTPLYAYCGPKSTVVVRWKTEPLSPRNLKYWRVEILPSSGGEQEGEVDLPSREIPASRRNLTVKLDFELERQMPVIIRITPIEASGQPSIDKETNEPICAQSDEFFLIPEDEANPEGPEVQPRETYSEATTIALGRLEQAMQTRAQKLEETSPQWSNKEAAYFSLRLDNRRTLTLGLSPVLKELEERTLRNSRGGGMFHLVVDDIRLVPVQKCQERYMVYGQEEIWKAFWNAREAFFKRLRQADPRHLLEVAEWTPELLNTATRYVQSYQGLLQTLLQQGMDDEQGELREAMSLDTVLVRVRDGRQKIEEALVVLPAHPLRVAWLVGYTQLLRNWEEQLLERMKPAARKNSIDLTALRLLAPINTPAIAFHADSSETFVFFQNLRFYHGVLLPVGVPDPHRRYGEIATILGADQDQVAIGMIQPQQLAAHLKRFSEMHPYISTLVTTLVNPDRGDFFAEALKQLVEPNGRSEEEEGNEGRHISAFQVTSYVEDERKSSVQALNRIRQSQLEQFSNSGGSYFLPGLSTKLRNISQLQQDEELADAHIAVISDFTQPSISTYCPREGESAIKSFTLYGLVCRFIPTLIKDEMGLVWRYQILTERLKPSEAHPVKAQYSDMLMNLHAVLLEAGARLLRGEVESKPALEVRLGEERRHLLERLHQNANWVVTLDRFFALDYYDSPHIEGLDEMARKYVLDYSPEFSEGMGHRMMITTSWHEEIGGLLREAMVEHGIAAIESSVSHLLHHLKIVSGSLALQALESRTRASAAVGLGLVASWLQQKNRLRQSVLVPVDFHPRLFSRESNGASTAGDRRCDLALFTLKRGIVEVTFIEVKWRRGDGPFDLLGEDMYFQMQASRRVLEDRFFNPERIDGALQRSHLGNVLRFYFERACRYQLFDPENRHTFLERLAELEKAGLEFRPGYEGYIVSLDERATTFTVHEAKIRVLTAGDFDSRAFPMLASFSQGSLLADTLLQDEGEAEEERTEEEELLSDVVRRIRTATLPSQKASAEDETAVPEREKVQYEPLRDEQEEAGVPDKEVEIALGRFHQGGECRWQPSVKGSPHLFIIGIPGQGKSWATTRLLIELGRQQVPALVLDFHGQFADPQEPFSRLIRPHVLDVAKGLPFSPFEYVPGEDRNNIKANSEEVAEIFAHVTNLGTIQQDIFYRALLNTYREKGFEQADAQASLAYPTMEEVAEQIKNQAGDRTQANQVLARCRSLLEMDLFRPEQGDTNLLAQIRRGLVLDLSKVQERLQLAAGSFILRKIYKDMFHWGPTDRLRLAIVLDEAHRLAKDITLPKFMKEGRKFGVLVIVASQELTDFHQGIISTVGSKVIFRINQPDARKAAALLQAPVGVDLARQVSQLPVGWAYVQTPEMLTAAKVQIYPLSY